MKGPQRKRQEESKNESQKETEIVVHWKGERNRETKRKIKKIEKRKSEKADAVIS